MDSSSCPLSITVNWGNKERGGNKEQKSGILKFMLSRIAQRVPECGANFVYF